MICVERLCDPRFEANDGSVSLAFVISRWSRWITATEREKYLSLQSKLSAALDAVWKVVSPIVVRHSVVGELCGADCGQCPASSSCCSRGVVRKHVCESVESTLTGARSLLAK